MDSAFEYVKNNGIMSSEDYPYEARDGICRINNSEIVTKVKGYVYIKENDESDLQAAIAEVGPVSIAIDASSFQLYESGKELPIFHDFVFSPKCIFLF